jgi:subtilisin family serine protease
MSTLDAPGYPTFPTASGSPDAGNTMGLMGGNNLNGGNLNGGNLNSGLMGPSMPALPTPWGQTTNSTSTAMIIAVIDSGIDFTHPALASGQWTNLTERANDRNDDRDGYPDDFHGWDWVAGSNQIRDEQGHGTAVAGIITAAGRRASETAGSAAWAATLMSLRVLDATGTGDDQRRARAAQALYEGRARQAGAGRRDELARESGRLRLHELSVQYARPVGGHHPGGTTGSGEVIGGSRFFIDRTFETGRRR